MLQTTREGKNTSSEKIVNFNNFDIKTNKIMYNTELPTNEENSKTTV